MKLTAELQHVLQRESRVVNTTARQIEAAFDQRVQQSEQSETRLEDRITSKAFEEMIVMRQKLHEQELAMQKMHQDAAFETQRKDTEIQRKAQLASTELEDVASVLPEEGC